MANLVDLKAQVDATTPTPTPTPSPTPAPVVRGDELMAKAQGYQTVPNEEVRVGKLFQQSQELMKARIEEDPAYAQATLPKLEKLTGDFAKYSQAVIDEADQIKVDYLKKQQPHWFTSGEAARVGFFNEATFGQMSKIIGKAGEVLQGRNYEEVVQEQAEKFRLLQKAFPGSFHTGEAASFLMPGSPAKALFTKAANLGTHLIEKIAGKIAKNPTYLEKISRAIVDGAAGTGAGSAALGGVEGTLGTDLESVSLDRGLESSLSKGTGGTLIGGGIPLGVGLVGGAVRVATPLINSAARGVRNTVASAVEQLSGTSSSALRAFNREGKALTRAAGTEGQIGADLVDFLQTQKLSQLPEVAKANEILQDLPAVDGRPVLNFLRSVKPGLDPSKDAHVKLLGEWADRIEAKFSDTAAVPASSLREIVDEMQDAVRNQYGKESPFLADQLKQAARIARQSIVSMAQKQGEQGQTYVQLMEKAAEKRSTLKFITKQLGTNPEVQAIRSQQYITNIVGGKKELAMQRMGDLDRQFGTNFLELAQNANYAKQLGPNGSPAAFSNLSTGKALAGVVTGGAIGGAPGAIAGQLASSPRTGAAIVGASDAITGFVKAMVGNPEALKVIAGRYAGRVAANGASGPGLSGSVFGSKDLRTLTRLRLPMEVQKLAGDVLTAFQKDGPISAGSLTRVIADTPYFFPLVHYYELADRQMKSRNVTPEGIQQRPNQELATPRGQ